MTKDLENALDVVAGRQDSSDYDRIYASSNEDLNELFRHFSVEGKDVLTVLASSDQYFYALDRGARSVDTFDINKLTKYYYYLRKWTILYENRYYPPKSFLQDHTYVYELLQKVQCTDIEEKKAFVFWRDFIQNVFPIDIGNMFYYSNVQNSFVDLDSLKDRIQGTSFTFYHQDIYDVISIPKKYDVIITSNILEYCGYHSVKLMRGRDHLKDLLKENGIIVCSHLFHSCTDSYFELEKGAFQRYFQYTEFPKYEGSRLLEKSGAGYTYTKKC